MRADVTGTEREMEASLKKLERGLHQKLRIGD